MRPGDKSSDDHEVGYGRPPKSAQFKKGQSGNPRGRPKKPDAAVLDLNAVLESEVQVNGAPMDSRELELRQQVKKALSTNGALKSVRYVIGEFEKYGSIRPPDPDAPAALPAYPEIPWAVQRILLARGEAPPWSPQLLADAKAEYLAGRDEGDRIYDVHAGYEEWLTM
ncbi:DUF5681 domain-containing protein [Ovoidimarina sediminis]|uniref:DUF5681 domain-containing protein n=1 Tax=Ovoidimarina sediminis TaxID=3079856 RepID=UPI00290F4296|nr:DUF5681 domain-containing protein [Rhodophyticola sp. MJ-SS7]MDU8945990.1 DUF5681 domain-containing protein [Rhodophyticola sp. MJ-SS7]